MNSDTNQQHANWSRRVHGLFDHYYYRVQKEDDKAQGEFFTKEIETRADMTLNSQKLQRNYEKENDDEMKFIAQALHGLKTSQKDSLRKDEEEIFEVSKQFGKASPAQKQDSSSFYISTVASQMKFNAANDVVAAKAAECQSEISEMMRLVKLYKENNFEALQKRMIEGKELIISDD